MISKTNTSLQPSLASLASQTSLKDELTRTLSKVGLAILFLVVLGSSLDQWFTGKMQEILTSPEGITGWIWLYGLFSILISILFPLAVLTLVVKATVAANSSQKTAEALLFKKFLKDLNQVLIETFRAWGKSLSWSFLFLLPGLLKWLRYSFVPFIVLESTKYQRGEVDALEYSERLSRGHLLKIIATTSFFSVVFPLLLTTWDEYKMIWKTPLPSLAMSLIETILAILFVLILQRIFRAATLTLPESLSPNNSSPPPEKL